MTPQKRRFVGEWVRLGDVLETTFSGEWGTEDGETLTPILRTANFNEDGTFDYETPALRCIPEKKIAAKRMRRGDIVLEKSGGTPKRPVGIMAYYDSDGLALCSNFNQVLRVNKDAFIPKYAFHQLRWLREREAFEPFTRKTTGLQNLQMKKFVDLELLKPDLHVQSVVVKQFDVIAHQTVLLKQQIVKLDSLVKSRFVEMFGRADYPSEAIDDIAEVQGGLTKNKKRDKLALSLPYLRVANVLMDKIDLSEMKSIGLTEQELNATKLLKGDLLFVEGNGSDSQIGRSAIWTGEIDPCVHQNHLIRVRFGRNVLPVYAQSYFSSLEGRAQVISKAVSTSGLLTLSTGKIKALRLPVPPLELQEEFAIFASQFDKSRFVELRNAEMSDCFRVLSDAKRLNGTAT